MIGPNLRNSRIYSNIESCRLRLQRPMQHAKLVMLTKSRPCICFQGNTIFTYRFGEPWQQHHNNARKEMDAPLLPIREMSPMSLKRMIVDLSSHSWKGQTASTTATIFARSYSPDTHPDHERHHISRRGRISTLCHAYTPCGIGDTSDIPSRLPALSDQETVQYRLPGHRSRLHRCN